MRLLNSSTIMIHEFHGSAIPPYAILSHTWGEDEVSLQDIEQSTCSRKIGYRKILRCCELAASEGWEFVWVDTCCIDKKSSAELSEAINSMYQWYERAEVCYVYLADLSWSHLDETSRREAFPEAFRRSRWFSRGWTLQELLAPRVVVFYDSEWKEVGTKWSLQGEISQATGIRLEHLADPKSASVAAKMSWASQRETTRVEDIAYCLMGIFDVNMPLLYGEGDRAFLRLQHEIIRASEDETLFAWKIPWDTAFTPSDESGILAPSPYAFRGAADFIPVKHPALTRRPYFMTNRGLEIDLLCVINGSLLQHDDRGSRLAYLNCGVRGTTNKYIAIMLSRFELNAQAPFIRSNPKILRIYHKQDLECSGLEWKTTYIRTVYQHNRTTNIPHPSFYVRKSRSFEQRFSLLESYEWTQSGKLLWLHDAQVLWGLSTVNGIAGMMFRDSQNYEERFLILIDMDGFVPKIHLLTIPKETTNFFFFPFNEYQEEKRTAKYVIQDRFIKSLCSGTRIFGSLKKGRLGGTTYIFVDIDIASDDDNQGPSNGIGE